MVRSGRPPIQDLVHGRLRPRDLLTRSRPTALEWVRRRSTSIPGTNIVLEEVRDSSTVWLDLDEPNPRLRYKMVLFLTEHPASPPVRRRRMGFTGRRPALAGPSGDRTTLFYNPFRKMWVVQPARPSRHTKLSSAATGATSSPELLLAHAHGPATRRLRGSPPDDLDRPRVDIGSRPLELHNLDCVAYESLMLGTVLDMLRRPERSARNSNHIQVGFSRDGFHWARPSRDPFIDVSERARRLELGQRAIGAAVAVSSSATARTSARQRPSGQSADSSVPALARLVWRRCVAIGSHRSMIADRLPRIAGLGTAKRAP